MPNHSIPEPDWRRAKNAIASYGAARLRLRDMQRKLPRLLARNDNKVGVAGEFWAMWFLHREGNSVRLVDRSNETGHDLLYGRKEPTVRVSVKVVSKESKHGKQMKFKKSSAWDEVLLVLLDDELLPYVFGLATRKEFEEAQKAGVGGSPTVSRSWVGNKGWITRFGKVYKATCREGRRWPVVRPD